MMVLVKPDQGREGSSEVLGESWSAREGYESRWFHREHFAETRTGWRRAVVDGMVLKYSGRGFGAAQARQGA